MGNKYDSEGHKRKSAFKKYNDVTLCLFHIYVSRGDVSIILKFLNTDYKIVAPWASACLRKTL